MSNFVSPLEEKDAFQAKITGFCGRTIIRDFLIQQKVTLWDHHQMEHSLHSLISKD